MATPGIISGLQSGIRTIILYAPETRNAFTIAMYQYVRTTLDADALNDDVKATILTGKGEYFSSGFDIKDAMTETSLGSSSEFKYMIDAFIRYPKLIVAVINGPAVGLGTTVCGLCDIVYASDKATFATPFVKIGLVVEAASSFILPRIMGRSKASEMILMAEKIDAREAYNFGLVSRIIEHGKLNEFVEELKVKLSDLSMASVRRSKALIMANLEGRLKEANAKEFLNLKECLESEEFGLAMMKFINKKSKL